jgi:hypothetical protein
MLKFISYYIGGLENIILSFHIYRHIGGTTYGSNPIAHYK